MIDPEMIPPEALEAAARAICEAENGPCECLPDECGCTYWQAHARAAILAALAAWPGVYANGLQKGWKHYTPALILPLNTETDNDQP